MGFVLECLVDITNDNTCGNLSQLQMCLWDQNLKFVLSQDILIMMLKIVSTKVSMNLTV